MEYTYYIAETLFLYNNVLYKVIQIRVINNPSKFHQGALDWGIRITDGINSVDNFNSRLSGNQKELIAFFTFDAFTSFTTNSKIEIVYGGYKVTGSIENVNIHNVIPLPVELEAIPHEIGDNAWLESIT